MQNIVALLWIALGMFMIVRSADYLVKGAASFAKKHRISEIVIGLTIVSFGTSAPELIVSTLSAWQGHSSIAIGNVLGSNIFNILLILGISGLIFPLQVQRNTVWKEIPLALAAVIVMLVMANDQWLDAQPFSLISRSEGIVLLLFFAIFLVYVFVIAKVEGDEQTAVEIYSSQWMFFYILGGLVGLFIGGRLVVNHGVEIATAFGISEKLIGLTLIAIGTSLPELATSVVAAWRKNSDIAIGNIIGSNIFNIFFILGTSAVIAPLPFEIQLNADMLVLLLATIFIFIFMFTGQKRRLDRWEAALFLAIYIGYTTFIILRK